MDGFLNFLAQKNEQNKAYDLLESLTRSGGLSLDFATLHVVIATTHTFDKSLMNTVIQDNQNPIEKVERSTLLLATTVLQIDDARRLLKPEFVDNVVAYSPQLFLEAPK